MRENLQKASRLFISKDNLNFFESKLQQNLENINFHYKEIKKIFKKFGIENFSKLPNDDLAKKEFAEHFAKLRKSIDKAVPEQFNWKQKDYEFNDSKCIIDINYADFEALLARYNDLPKKESEEYQEYISINPFESENIGFSLNEKNLSKYIIEYQENISNYDLLKEIKKRMNVLSSDDQEIINDLLSKIANGLLTINKDFDINQYISEINKLNEDKIINEFLEVIGSDKKEQLLSLINNFCDDKELSASKDFESFIDSLSCDKEKITSIIKNKYGKEFKWREIIRLVDNYLKKMISNKKTSFQKFINNLENIK